MLELLYKIFIGHLHKWVVIEKTKVTSNNGEKWTRHYCQCEKCGIIKAFNV